MFQHRGKLSIMQEPYKKPVRPRAPPLLYILLTALFLALPRTVIFPNTKTVNPEVETLHPCGRIVLVSAARHGSTWFVDSAEGCTAQNGSFGRLNREIELWNPGQKGNIRDLEPRVAARYAKMNRSLKIFPPALLKRDPEDLQTFFEHVKLLQVPVFVLRRRLEDSYGSLALAKETNVWNASRADTMDAKEEREIVKDAKYNLYVSRINEHFESVKALMKNAGVVWDQFDYEIVSQKDIIVGERNNCFIKNCNFRRR